MQPLDCRKLNGPAPLRITDRPAFGRIHAKRSVWTPLVVIAKILA